MPSEGRGHTLRTLSVAPLQNKKENRTAEAFVDIIAALPSDTGCGSSHRVRSRRKALPARSPRRAERRCSELRNEEKETIANPERA